MATRGQLINEVISELHLESASYTAQVVTALGEAVDFYRPERFWCTEGGTTSLTLTLTSAIQLSDLPDSVTIDSVRVVDNSGNTYSLLQDNWAEFQDRASMTSQPTRYAIHAAQLHVWPANDATRSIEFTWAGRTTMTASNSSSTVYTNDLRELIKLHVKASLCENFLLDLPAADRYRGREGTVLGQLVSETIKRLGIGQNMKGHL